MKHNLKSYLQSLFLDVPHSSANDTLFEELYGNLCDRYDELIAQGLTEEEAYARAIGEVGDIRPLIDWSGAPKPVGEGGQKAYQTPPAATFYRTTEREKSNGSSKRRLDKTELRRAKHIRAWGLAVAVMLYIIWIAPIVLWETVSALFVCVAVGTLALVLSHTRVPAFLDDSLVSYDETVCKTDARVADILQAFGIALCILCVLPAITIHSNIGVALMFAAVAIGVGMILLAAGIRPRAPKGSSMRAPEPAAASVGQAEQPREKRRNRWLLPVIFFSVAALIGIGIFLGVRHDFNFGFYTDGDLFDHYTTVGNGEVTEPVSDIVIYWCEGSVEVKPYDGECISITETVTDGSAQKDRDRMRWGTYGGKLAIRYNERRSTLFHFGKEHDKTLTVLIPRAMAQELNTVEVNSVSAAVLVAEIHVGQTLSLESVSGNLNMIDCTAGMLKLDTVSGLINATRANVSTSTKVNTVSGNVSVTESALGEVDVNSVSGDLYFTAVLLTEWNGDSTSGNIRLCLTGDFRKIECDTVSGNVTVELPADIDGFTAELDSASGNFQTDFAVTQSGSRRVFGNGTGTIEVDTTSGDCFIKQYTP